MASACSDSTAPADEDAASEPLGPAGIRVDAGDAQSAPIGGRLPNELAVRVDNDRGAPLTGAEIDWALVDSAGSGAELGAATTATDAEGIGTNTLTLGDSPGEYVVAATLAELPGESVIFRLTATRAPVITGIEPDPVVEGASATLFGANFAPTAEDNIVFFDGRIATVTAAGTGQLSVDLPVAGCLPARDSASFVVELGGVPSDTTWHPALPNEEPATALAAAEARIRSDSAAVECVQLPAADDSVEFLLIAAVATGEPGILVPERLQRRTGADSSFGVGSFARVPWLQGDGDGSGAGADAELSSPAVRHSSTASQSAQLARTLERAEAAAAAELRIRRYERELFRRVAPATRSSRARDAAANTAAGRAAEPPEVGDTLELTVTDVSSDDLCSEFDTIQAVVKAVGEHGMAVEDTATPDDGFTDADYEDIVAEFDVATYPTDTVYFGGATDMDENDRVLLVFTPEVNELSDPEDRGFVGGFFFGGDLFQDTDCPASNQGELLYMLVPDPTGEFGRSFATNFVHELSRGTAAHELQHLINAAQRLFFVTGTTSLEEIWLSEALSHLAEEVVGHVVLGLSSGSNITIAESFDPHPDDYDAFYFQNLARLNVYLEDSDTLSSQSPIDPDADLATRGAAWSLLRWMLDQHADPANEAAVTRSMVATTETGIENLETALGVPFEEMQPAWLLALYADDFVEGADPRFSFTTWNLRDIYESDPRFRRFPIQPVPLEPADTAIEYGVLSGSGRYFRVQLSGDSPAMSLQFTTPGGAPLTEATEAPRTLLLRLP